MLNTKLLFFLCACSLAQTLQGQKLDIDGYWVKTNMINLPSTILGPEYSTYTVTFVGINNVQSWGFLPERIRSDYSKLSGFNQLERGPADLTWTIQINPITFGQSEIKSSSTKSKDKAGRETTTTEYWFQQPYYTHFEAVIKDKTGKRIYSYNDGQEGTAQIMKGSSTSTYKAALDAFNQDGSTMRANIASSAIKNSLSLINSQVNARIGYQLVVPSFKLYITDSPKHPENEAFASHVKACKSLFAEIPATELPENILAQLREHISYFETVPTRYASDEKIDKKLRYTAYYNIAMIYQNLDMLDESSEAANLLIKNDYDPKDGKNIIKDNDEIRVALLKANEKSRRFVRLKAPTEVVEEAPPTTKGN